MLMSEPRVTKAVGASRQENILSTLKSILYDLSGMNPAEVDSHATFFELGADSLLLLQASQTIQSKVGVKIPFRLLMEDASTLESLASYIDQNLPPEKSQSEPLSQETVEDDSAQEQAIFQTQNSFENEASFAPTDNEEIDPVPVSVSERIIAQQLQVMFNIMSKQLELLNNGHSSESAVYDRHGAQPGVEQAGRQAAQVSSAADTDGARQPGEMIKTEPYIPYKPINKSGVSGLNARQHSHLNQLIARVTERTKESKRRSQQYRPFHATSASSVGFRLAWKEMLYPLIVDHASGARVWDVDGNEYIDVAMGFGSLLFGHSPSFVMEILQQQTYQGMKIGLQSDFTGEAARLICENDRHGAGCLLQFGHGSGYVGASYSAGSHKP